MIAWIRTAWSRFWFDHPSALSLAVARILVGIQGLWMLLSRDYPGVSGLPDPFWNQVATSTRWRYLMFPGNVGLEQVLQWFAVVALVAVVLGVHARVACLVSGLLLYHLAPFEAIIWMSSPYVRGLTMPVLALLILSFARCGDRLSMVPRTRAPASVTPSLDYSWQLRLLQLLVALIYLFSGWAKIRAAGVGWASGDNVRRWILYLTQDPEFGVFQAPGTWIAARPALCLGIGVTTLLFEVGFVAVMFSTRSRRWLVPLAVLFHVGILFTMNLTFITMLLLLMFVNWDWVWERFGRAKAAGAAAPSPVST